MPLAKDSTQEIISKNIDMSTAESKRSEDINGFLEIKDNPISKVGIFPYSGKQINPELDPEKIYYVYRSAEELSSPETIESFKLLPWIDDHEMLGKNLTPAEQKGVQGAVGENVYFDSGYLKANIKIFSEKLRNLIENGKKELSIGYRCLYELKSGLYNGEKYDAIQHTIRGNHLALVDEGRAGPDVAVLDHFTFTLDMGLKMEKEKEQAKDEGVSLEALAEKIDKLLEAFGKMSKSGGDEEPPAKKTSDEEGDMEKPADEKEAKDEEMPEDEKEELKDNKKSIDESPVKKEGMDKMIKAFKALAADVAELQRNNPRDFMRQLSERDALAAELSHYIGTFDHAEKTVDEVAQYGVKKLGIACAKGTERAVLSGYLKGRQSVSQELYATMDSNASNSGDQIDEYLHGSN